MVGLPARSTEQESAAGVGAGAASGDTKLQQLLHHISRSRPDWAQVTRDWDALGAAVPMLVRLSPRAPAELAARPTDVALGRDLGMDRSTAGDRVAAAVARAGGSRLAVSKALQVEEASLLQAEEQILLQRRNADARAISRAREQARSS